MPGGLPDTLSNRTDMDWTLVLVAFAGGAIGAAYGANASFIVTGVFVLIGVAVAAGGGGKDFIGAVAFGPLFGPHVGFAGGAAAAAYAARRGLIPSGRDLGVGLAGTNRPDVLLVGGLFGVAGYILQSLLGISPIGKLTDTIALTVVLSAVIVRLLLGKSGLFGKRTPDAKWLPFQHDTLQLLTLGTALGLSSAYCAKLLGAEKGGDVVGFGLAAFGLLFLHTGTTVPVWHHIALPAAIAVGMTGGSLWAGTLAGIAGAFLGEIYARIFLVNGDTHIDPPAAAIATMTLLLRLLL
jgi:hypothetical protein